jgi:hypothetical protein
MAALTSEEVVSGTLDDLAARLGVSADDLRTCLRDLADRRLIAIQTQPGGYLTIRVERRSEGSLRSHRDRRRVRDQDWRL